MEFNVALVLGFVGIALGVISYKCLNVYMNSSAKLMQQQEKMSFQTRVLHLENENEKLANATKGLRYRNQQMRENYDLEFDDFETEEEEDDGKLSDLVKYIYPKMPKSLKTIIDNEDLQEVVLKRFKENPNKTLGFLEKIIPKEKTSDQGSTNKPVEYLGV